MGLQEIYVNNVDKHSVSMGTHGSIGGVTKERDPKLQQLESTVNNAMSQAIQQKAPPPLEAKTETKTEVEEIGVAQAIKELLNLENLPEQQQPEEIKPENCDHTWYNVHNSFDSDMKPTGRRCSKCSTQEWF